MVPMAEGKVIADRNLPARGSAIMVYWKMSIVMNKQFTASLLTLLLLQPFGLLDAQEKGRELFLDNCAECHQSNGQGLENIYPALAGNETVRGSGADVALVLMIGRGEMPSFKDALDSEEMAAIINYVRNSWGNSGANISAGEIEQLR